LSVEYELASRLEVSTHLRECIREYLQGQAAEFATEEDILVIELALSEAVSNICKHAYKGELDRPIWMNVRNNRHELEIVLSHLGEAPRLEDIPPPIFDGTKESGFGVFIMRQCMDAVEYRVDANNRPCVSLKKRLGKGLSQDASSI
jgi:anti-sigma regulatory factor (Ser/Thr protein kinase)